MPSAVYAWTTDGRVRTVSPPGGRSWVSCIHPDGGFALFAHVTDGGASRIWRASIPSGDCEPVTRDGWFASLPSIAADGATVVFAGAGDGSPGDLFQPGVNVFAMDAAGRGVRQLTRGPYRDTRPAPSPDGSTVAFFSDRGEGGRWGLWLVDAGGGEPRLLLDTPVGRPWWSVDGATIFCFRIEPDTCRLIAVDAADGSWEHVANDPGHTHGAFADLRGDRLIVHTTRGRARMTLWELPLDGSEPAELVPDGMQGMHYAHGTRARDGTMTFDHTPPQGPVADVRDALGTPTSCWRTVQPA